MTRSGEGGVDPAELYRRLAPAVLGYLRAQRVAEPEDLLGEVFVQVARDRRKAPAGEVEVRKWVFAIARHRVIDEARRRGRRARFVGGGRGGGRVSVVEAPAEPLDPELVRALGTLTAEQREVVVLRFVADLSLETVAELTGRPVGAVKSMQHRALAQLAVVLGSGSAAVSPRPRPAL